uniref:Rhino n=1 Tax=Drosophila ananassae TaxID=7217 RepID=Q49BJ2_DROAN|nr:rhino [Drosophila ananassae]
MSQAPGSSSKPTETWSAVEFVVEKICGKRFNCGRPELLVKWMGFPEQDNSWEPLENLGNCIQMVCDFEAELFTKTCGKSLTVAIPRDVLNLSPKPPMATRSTFMANAKTSKRKLESPKKRRQSSASSSISSQPAAKNSSSKSQTRSAPPLSVSLLNDLDLSEQSDDEVLVSTLQMLPPLKPPESDNLRNSVPVKESLEKERETSPRERNLSSSSSSSCLLSSTGSESDSTQTSKTSNTSNASNTSMTRQASLAPPPTSKCLPPTEKSPSPTKLLPSSPKTEKAEGDLLSSLKMKARQWDRSNRVVKMGGFLEAGMFKPVNDVTKRSCENRTPISVDRSEKKCIFNSERGAHWFNIEAQEVASPDVSQTKNEVQKRRRVTIGPGNYKVKIEPPSPATPAMPVSTSRSIRISSSSGSSRRSPSRPAWKMSPSKKATVYGLKRGLPLDKVFHRFRVKDKTFLIVLWKGCSQPDAVLLDEIQDIYPLQVIQYFEGLKLRYDAL